MQVTSGCLVTLSIAASLYSASAQNSYACPPGSKGWPCLRDANGNPLTIRVVFMDKAFVTSNPAAVAKVNSLGKSYIPGTTCDKAAFAVPECFVFENWNGGWVGGFMQQTLKDLGVNVIAMTKANFSAAANAIKTPSSFTRCVWDVKFGNVDLCVGDFWETPERRNLSAFTAAIDSDAFTLFTTLNQSAVLPPFNPHMFMAIFAPFDNSVWLLCGITILVCSAALKIVQSPEKDGIIQSDNGNADTDNADNGKKNEKGKPESFFKFLSELPQAIWDTTMSFLGGEDAVVDSSTNWPARFISIGLGIFVFIHVNSYTGSLAAYYVSNNMVQLGAITSLDDIKAQGGKLCLYQSMAAATLPIISTAVPASQMIQMDNYGPMLEQLYEGNCLGAVVGKFETLTFISAANVNFTVCMDPNDPNHFSACANTSIQPTSFNLNPATCGKQCDYAGRFCQLVRLQDPTISSITLSWEMPVRKDLEPWVSWAMLRIHTAGNLSLYQNNEINSKNPVLCSAPVPPSQSLGIRELCGTFLFCGGTMVIALLVHLCFIAASLGTARRAAPRSDEEGAAAAATDGDVPLGKAAAAGASGRDSDLAGRLADALKEVEAILNKAKKL